MKARKGNGEIHWPAPNQELYDAGIAVGAPNIRHDSMTLRWNDEVYELPLAEALRVAKHNGYWYWAKVKALRKLVKELGYGRIL
jgi:hypothetical protein